MGYIYKITNKLNLKIYIGKCQCSIEARFKQHCRRALHWFDKPQKFRSHLYPAMFYDGIDNFEIALLEECQNNELGNREKYYIKLFDSCNSDIGYNIAVGGNSFWEGKHHSDESKEKISAHSAKYLLGKHLSEETKEKISQANAGKSNFEGHQHSEEAKDKIRQSKLGKAGGMRGKKQTKQAKEKIRKANLGKKRSKEELAKQSLTLKKLWATRTGEQRSAAGKKSWETRRKNKENLKKEEK